MGIGFQMGQILWEIISPCEIWHACQDSPGIMTYHHEFFYEGSQEFATICGSVVNRRQNRDSVTGALTKTLEESEKWTRRK